MRANSPCVPYSPLSPDSSSCFRLSPQSLRLGPRVYSLTGEHEPRSSSAATQCVTFCCETTCFSQDGCSCSAPATPTSLARSAMLCRIQPGTVASFSFFAAFAAVGGSAALAELSLPVPTAELRRRDSGQVCWPSSPSLKGIAPSAAVLLASGCSSAAPPRGRRRATPLALSLGGS